MSGAMSFRKSLNADRTVQSAIGSGEFCRFSKRIFRQSVKYTLFINLQRTRELVIDKKCWPHCMTFECPMNWGEYYIGIRIGIFFCGMNRNLHISSVPFCESHPGNSLYKAGPIISSSNIGQKWLLMLISAIKESGIIMKGRNQGAVTRLNRFRG